MENEKPHKPFSASSLSDNLSNKRKTRKQSKDKPSKTPNLPVEEFDSTAKTERAYQLKLRKWFTKGFLSKDIYELTNRITMS